MPYSNDELDPRKNLNRGDCYVVELNGRDMAAFTYTVRGFTMAINRLAQLREDYPRSTARIINPNQSEPGNPDGLNEIENILLDMWSEYGPV